MEGLVKNEQVALRCFIQFPEYINLMDDNYFVAELGHDLFEVLKTLNEQGVRFTKKHIVIQGNKVNPAINAETLDELWQVEYDPGQFDYYAEQLKKNYTAHKLENFTLKEVVTTVSSKGELNTDKLEELVDEIQSGLNIIKSRRDLLLRPSTMLERYEAEIMKRARGEHRHSSGDSYLDTALLVGMAPGLITTIFASTGLGKSVYALNLVNKQFNRHIPSLYISLEMDLVPTMDRLIAMRHRIPIQAMYPHGDDLELPAQLYSAIEQEKRVMGRNRSFLFVEEVGLSVSDIEYIIKDAKKRMGTDYMIVTIDLLTMLKDFAGGGDKQSTVYENTMNTLHEMVRKHGVHLIGVVQANREADSAKITEIAKIDKLRPTRNTIKNSQAIAERSRVVLGVFRPRFYTELLFPGAPELDTMDDIMEIDILKQNMGMVQRLKYLYQPETANIYRFVETEHDTQNDSTDETETETTSESNQDDQEF